MIPSATDLFGEVPVTAADLNTWCDHLNKHWPTEWRRDWYIENWNVADKVRQSKLSGEFFRLRH